jgi:hypothetical protein
MCVFTSQGFIVSSNHTTIIQAHRAFPVPALASRRLGARPQLSSSLTTTSTRVPTNCTLHTTRTHHKMAGGSSDPNARHKATYVLRHSTLYRPQHPVQSPHLPRESRITLTSAVTRFNKR